MYCGKRKLAQIKDLPSNDLQYLHSAHIITCEDFLTLSSLELMTVLRCSHTHYLELRTLVSTIISPHPQTVLSLHCTNKRNLPTTLQPLDSAMLGGLPAGTITEVAAPSGCGKTQLCLMLTMLACLSLKCGGDDSNVIYVDTEGAFSAQRLLEMAKSAYPSYFTTDNDIESLTNKIHVYRELTCTALQKRLESLDLLVGIGNIGLVLVDSIASLLRKEYDTRTTRGVAERSTMLLHFTTILKSVAVDYQIPVVVTNQITTKFMATKSSELFDDDKIITASLGNTWTHCINTRLILEFWKKDKRKLSVAKSSVCSPISMIVNLEEKGFVVDWTETNELVSPFNGDPTTYSLTVKSDITN